MSSTPPEPEKTSSTSTTTTPVTDLKSQHSIVKLRKIPPIPVRQSASHTDDATDDDRQNDEQNHEDSSFIIHASALGLNHIRTRSAPSPLRFVSTAATPSKLGHVDGKRGGKDGTGTEIRRKPQFTDEGKRVQWSQSKSLRATAPTNSDFEGNHAALSKEIQSPRFQAILRATSGRKKRVPDIKSFSHELNSKGVRPLPLWKSRAFGRMEEIMLMLRGKFDKLKEEVNADLGIYAGDLVGILDKTSGAHPEWREILEDLLIISRKITKMTPNEFWLKCEGIVQSLDDRRQELPMGILKQVHTRLLFILTRCTRLVQFHKECGYEEDHILGLHQLSDLGVYPEQVLGPPSQRFSGPFEKGVIEAYAGQKQDQANTNLDSGPDTTEVSTAKSVASSTGSFRMSSWKKLPSAAEKNRKGPGSVDTPSKDNSDRLQLKDDNIDNVDTPMLRPELSEASLRVRKAATGVLGDQNNITYESSLICRICEVEIPTIHVEEHSRICTIADRCDLKGLTVNERLDRVADTLERIIESWTPVSTDTAVLSPEVGRVSISSTTEDLDELSPKKHNVSHQYSDYMLECVPEADNRLTLDNFHPSPNMSCESRGILTPERGKHASSAGSLTPTSPLLTPRTNQIDLLLSGKKTMAENENCLQINKLLDIARSVANVNTNDYSALEYMLDRLKELNHAIQDRKVDALVVETFGRRIEKLLQEKYVLLCGQIDDDKMESSHNISSEDSLGEDDTVRSVRVSPINQYSKDRISIEDFEIIKPISRGAFGRVFLARKRSTGDLFAIKVLRKADMIRKNAVQSILAERDILISVRNPFVVRFFYSFTCRENLYLVMEYLNGGDLFSLLRNLGCLEEDMARVYIAELVLALEYLHSLNVIHRDLKPDNLLIGPDGHIKLTDFGLSKVGLINSTEDLSAPSVNSVELQDNEQKTEAKSSLKRERQKHSVVGTPDYLAPEILLGMGHGFTADWWSVGVILFELIVGIPPFNAEHPQQIFDNIMNRDIPWPKVPDEISYEAYDLINKLLSENPVQRLGATGAGEVKRHPFFRNILWDTLARQKAAFIPSTEALDTSYFMSRYIWNPEDEHVDGGSDFDELSDTDCSGSGSSYSYMHDEEGDECGHLTEFNNTPALQLNYSFSNFSFKNLSQLASINYDLLVKNAQESEQAQAAKQAIP